MTDRPTGSAPATRRDRRLHLLPRHRTQIEALLREHLPNVEVWAYGSRVSGDSHDGSDLDLVLRTPDLKKVPMELLCDLSEALRESTIPFLVEARDWARLPKTFHGEIEQDYVVLVEALDCAQRAQRTDRATETPPRIGKGTLNRRRRCRWKEYAVRELLDSGVLEIGDGYRAKNSELSNSGLPFARAGNIRDGFRFNDADCFPTKNLDRVKNKVSRPGDVVFTSKGTVGRFAFVREDTPRFVYSPQLCFWRSLDRALIDPRFLFCWMSGREFFEQFKEVSGQTDMAEFVSLRDQRNMRITLPPISEQRAIAHILGTLDDRIELNRRMNETLEAMAQALFKSWFVDFDPVRAKMEGRNPGLPKNIADMFPNRLVDSALGPVPDGWTRGHLSDIAVSTRKGSRPEDLPSDTPYIGLEHMPRRSISLAEWKTVKKVKSNKLIFSKGSILFGKLRPYFHKVGISPVDGVCSTDIMVIEPKVPTWSSFVLETVSSADFVKYADRTSTGTRMPRSSWKALSQYGLTLPPTTLTGAYQTITKTPLDRILSNIHESWFLLRVRDLLLFRLVSGTLRLGGAECEA